MSGFCMQARPDQCYTQAGSYLQSSSLRYYGPASVEWVVLAALAVPCVHVQKSSRAAVLCTYILCPVKDYPGVASEQATKPASAGWLALPAQSRRLHVCFILIYTHPHPWYCTVHGTQTTYIRPGEGTRRGETTTSAHGHIHKQAQNHAWVFLAHRPCRGCLGGGAFCHQVGVNGLGPFLSCLQPRLFWRRNSLGDFCMALVGSGRGSYVPRRLLHYEQGEKHVSSAYSVGRLLEGLSRVFVSLIRPLRPREVTAQVPTSSSVLFSWPSPLNGFLV
jgi:hypothetical protein